MVVFKFNHLICDLLCRLLLWCFHRHEILEALPEVDVVFIPVSGGGLISGIAAYLKEAKPSVKVGSVKGEPHH